MMFNQDCTLIYPGELEGHDEYREPVYGEPRREPACSWVETGGTAEDQYFANQVEWTHNFYFPEDTDPRFEQIEWDGETFDVVGRPQKQPGGLLIDGWLFAGAKAVTG